MLHAEDDVDTIRRVAGLLDTLEPKRDDTWLESPTTSPGSGDVAAGSPLVPRLGARGVPTPVRD